MGDNVNSRQRLKPWLESKIESGMIPDLCWIDRNEKKFRIPWKRNGTTEWEKEDSAIFRDWAIHTGKYREGIDKIDYPYWKTRLRCALTKHPEIIECKEENISHGNNPYRVYRIADNSICDEILPTMDNDVEMVEDIQHGTMTMELVPAIADIDDLRSISLSQLMKIPSGEVRRLHQSLEAERIRCEEAERLKYDFEVIINFQFKEVLKTWVRDSCFLTKVFDSQEIQAPCQVISFPDPPEKEQVQSITEVLWPNLKDGIYFKFDMYKNILAQRLCKCRIYFRDQNNRDGLKLERSDGSTWTIIFDYRKFCEDFDNGNEQISGSTTLYIGQRCDPDPNKVFFSVAIYHLEAMQHLNKRLSQTHKVSVSMSM